MRIVKNAFQLIMLTLIVLLSSCTFETLDGTVVKEGESGLFQADFNGKTWSSAENQAKVSGNFIEISAINANGEGFAFMIEGGTVGTYATNINLIAYIPTDSEFGYWAINGNNPTEDTGSVVITNIDKASKTISGTFQFKGYWSDSNSTKPAIQFTKGVFKDIPYTTQEESTDVFTAKVGNTNFVATDILTAEIGIGLDDFITIGAQDVNSNTISIAIKTTLGNGNHTIINTIGADVQGYYENADGEYKAVSGNVTVTSKTADRIKGTFQFTTDGATPFVITQGNFDVEY